MAQHYPAPFEIHIHGEIILLPDVRIEDLQTALRPLWRYAGAGSLREGSISKYEEEPGIQFDAKQSMLRICWTVRGADDFRQVIDEMCLNLNELTKLGTAIEVTFYDIEFDNDNGSSEHKDGSRDDFMLVFLGPTPAAIMRAQRDFLVRDVTGLMERHFANNELDGVVAAIDKLFTNRFDSLVASLELNKPPKHFSSEPKKSDMQQPSSGHNKPRRLH